MRILFVNKNDKERALYSIYLENIFKSTEIVQLFTSEQARELIVKDGQFDFILFNNNADNEYDAGDFYRLVRSKYSDIPFILFSSESPDSAKGLEGMRSHHPKNGYIKMPISPTDFRVEILNILSPSRFGTSLVSAFHRIRLIHFFRFNKVLCDVYLKESDRKYVKVLKKDTRYKLEAIETLRKNKIDFLYIRNDDFENFHVTLANTPFLIMDMEGISEIDFDQVMATTHIVLKDLVRTMGFSEEAIGLAEKSVKEISKRALNNYSLNELIHKQRKRQDYLYDHSYLTSMVCCEIINGVNSGNEKNVQTLCMASIFHDLTLDNPDMAMVTDQYDPMLERFSEKEIKDYLRHPVAAIEILDRVEYIPAEVKTIILQHHETPEGNGYPNKIHPSRLSGLTCTFIIAHDYVRSMYEINFDPNQEFTIFDKFKKRYTVGNFVPILEAFYRCHVKEKEGKKSA